MANFGELLDAARRTEVCVANLPGFIPPLQIRTQKKTDVIVSSTAHLLQERSFESISIQEIAQLSKCSVTSIYARFVDKEALLPAVNLVVMEHYRLVVTSLFATMKVPNLEAVCKSYLELNAGFYRDNSNLIKAAGHIKSDYIFQQMNSLFRSCAPIIAAAINSQGELKGSIKIQPVEFAIEQVHTNFRDKIACGSLSTFNYLSLADLFCMIIKNGLS